MNNMSDLDILNHDIGGQKVIEMSAITFLSWMIGKLNGLEANNPTVIELRMYATGMIIGRMPEYKKIEIIKKLLSLNVQI